ncbi:uncharacterized protein B0T15DRAFT_23298 [Chaetomium strumarium]|uniref:HMG box domain-containing protein n=1 Tax=Chaetomium strumarium TaxID=1170767 RepID=A0AAJ0H1F7_9PEZI|nr:hypothetical protein B0T15DRAFT_23298 [Chaetomium strumarium]
MTQLIEAIFGELGITQYLDAFIEQGFDTWETILDITESDLDALGVKLGHRRKLQRRIANSRGVAPDASLVSPTQSTAEEVKPQDVVVKAEPTTTLEVRETVGVIVTKRKYRRHPKPDDNAPERPPSAYVLFSNKMREELKGRNLSFTEIAKLVGENWQNLTAAEKEPFESQAQAMKDKFLADFAEYKKTPEFRKYQVYLQEFKAKYGSPSQDKDASKRVRLSESGGQGRGSPNATPTRSSRSGSGAESRRTSEPPPGRQRVDSGVSSSESQHTGSLPASAPIGAADEPVFSPCVSDSSGRSPTFKQEPGDQTGDEQARDQTGMHRHLPSLSDVFDGRELPLGGRPSAETSRFRFLSTNVAGGPGHSMAHAGRDMRPALSLDGQPYVGNSSTHPSFGQPRAPADGGPLPIHALLASRPEPPFSSNQLPYPHHGTPYHVDPKPRPVHQPPNGAAGLPMINGYHHVTPSLPQHHASVTPVHITAGFSTQSQPTASASPDRSPQHGKRNTNFDGMSALLKAGELVDRRMY